jgi:hypothetical protein
MSNPHKPTKSNAPGAVDTNAGRRELIAKYQRRGVESADAFVAFRAAMLANLICVAFERSANVRKTLRRCRSPQDYVDNIPALSNYSRVLKTVGTLAALELRR